MTKPMAHRSDVEAEDPRARARWRYHVDVAHKVPPGGATARHFYACSWCRPQKIDAAYSDTEWEQYLIPAGVGNSMAEWLAFGRTNP